MASAELDLVRRRITITNIARPAPTGDARAALHRLLDYAIDALDDPGTDLEIAEPQSPTGRVAE